MVVLGVLVLGALFSPAALGATTSPSDLGPTGWISGSGDPNLGVLNQGARTINFDGGWRFNFVNTNDTSDPSGSFGNSSDPKAAATDFNDASWEHLTLPHDWSITPLPRPDQMLKNLDGLGLNYDTAKTIDGLHATYPVGAVVGLSLAHQVAQRLLANHRPDRPADRVVGMLDRRLGEREQDPALAANVLQIGDQLLLDAVLGARIHLVHHANQQIDQAVGDLARARQTKARQQRQAHLSRMGAQPRRMLGGRARAPRPDPLLLRLGKQVGRQADRPHPLELGDLGKQRLKARRPRVRAKVGKQSWSASDHPVVIAGALGHEFLEPLDRNRRKPRDRARTEPLVGQAPRAADDPADPPGRL